MMWSDHPADSTGGRLQDVHHDYRSRRDPGKGRTAALELDLPDESITVRDLIRARIYAEVAAYDARAEGHYQGLVQPTDAERTLDGYELRPGRRIDAEGQFLKALAAFQANGVLVLVDDRQMEHLDDRFPLRRDTTICFLRLMPLVGG